MNELVGPIAALLDASDKVAVAGNWITSVSETVKEVGAEEAAWKPGPEERSIFEIVLHMTVWTDWATHFVQGHDSETEEWPPVTRTDTGAWEEVRDNLNRALSHFRTSIAALSPDALSHAPVPEVTKTTNLSALLSILLHNAYHAGQITKLHERWLTERG